MGLFNVQIYGATTWVKPHTKWHARWNITVPFYSVADAQAGIKAWKEGSGEHLPHFRFRVIDENGHVVWSDHQPAEKEETHQA